MPGRDFVALRLVSMVASAAFLAVSLFGVWYPYTLEPYEGTVLLPAQRMASGLAIYGPEVLLRPPYLWSAYGPGFYIVCGLLMKALGSAPLWPGRLVSLLATVGTGALVGVCVHRRRGSRPGAVAALAVFAVLPTTWSFGALCRVDALAVFLSMAAASLFLGAEGRNGRIFLAGCSAALALLTKATVVGAALAVVVTLAAERRWRALGVFFVGGAAVTALTAALLHATGNDGYWPSQLANSQVPFRMSVAIKVFRAFAQNYIVLSAVMLSIAGLAVAKRGRRDAVESFAFLFLGASGLIAAITTAKAGANINYYCEFGVALALNAGLAVARLGITRSLSEAASELHLKMLAIAVVGQLLVFNVSYVEGRVFMPLRRAAVYRRAIEEIARHVPPTGSVGGEYPELALQAKRQVWMNDWAMFVLGPEPVRRIRAESIDRRSVDAWVMVGGGVFPGYVQLEIGSTDPVSMSGNPHHLGPLVFVRQEAAQLGSPGGTPD